MPRSGRALVLLRGSRSTHLKVCLNPSNASEVSTKGAHTTARSAKWRSAELVAAAFCMNARTWVGNTIFCAVSRTSSANAGAKAVSYDTELPSTLKRSTPPATAQNPNFLIWTFAAASVDLIARLAVPASIVALAQGHAQAALVAAAALNALALLRGLLTGALLERSLRHFWAVLVEAMTGHDVASLRARSSDQAVGLLVQAADLSANIWAGTIPRLAANTVGLLLVGSAVAWLVGWAWTALGLIGLGFLGGLFAVSHRSQARAERASHALMIEIFNDLEVLLDGCAELRAHDRQAGFCQDMLARVASFASLKRRVAIHSALLALVPLGVALLLAVPALSWDKVAQQLAGSGANIATIGALVATTLVLAIGTARAAAELARSRPQRRLLERFVAEAVPAEPEERNPNKPAGWLRDAEISFEDVAIRYPGSSAETPSAVRHCWKAGESLALLGENGAGKSSLALALLGLLPASRGRICFDGEPSNADLARQLKLRVAYLPQQAFLSASRSVGYHLRMLAGEELSEPQLEKALDKLGLGDTLRSRGLAGRCSELCAAELSGGERRRMHLARMFLPHHGEAPELLILDEPEAGLDAAGRKLLMQLIEELSQTARVLLIAHDPQIVPDKFARLTCGRQAVDV